MPLGAVAQQHRMAHGGAAASLPALAPAAQCGSCWHRPHTGPQVQAGRGSQSLSLLGGDGLLIHGQGFSKGFKPKPSFLRSFPQPLPSQWPVAGAGLEDPQNPSQGLPGAGTHLPPAPAALSGSPPHKPCLGATSRARGGVSEQVALLGTDGRGGWQDGSAAAPTRASGCPPQGLGRGGPSRGRYPGRPEWPSLYCWGSSRVRGWGWGEGAPVVPALPARHGGAGVHWLSSRPLHCKVGPLGRGP